MAEVTDVPFDVASNPEFLKEGAAIDDFNKPDRVVVGVRRPEVGERAARAVRPVPADRAAVPGHDARESAEMTKYVANACWRPRSASSTRWPTSARRYGADINDVRRGIGHDQRIGFSSSSRASATAAAASPRTSARSSTWPSTRGLPPRMMEAVDEVNEAQKQVLVRKIRDHFERRRCAGKTLAVWGLAFKPRTDDIREAPALVLIDALLAAGAQRPRPRPRGDGQRPRASTATSSTTATAPTARSKRPTPWRSSPSGTSSATPTSR